MSNFNLEKELNDYTCPRMFKAGLRYYIESNNLKINNNKEFMKIVKQYSELKVGE